MNQLVWMMCTIFPWAHHEENQKFYSTHEHFVHTVIVWEKREALNSGHFPSTHNHKPWSLISLQQVNKSHIIIYMHIYYSGGNNLSNHIVTLKMGSVGRMQFSIPDKHTHVQWTCVCGMRIQIRFSISPYQYQTLPSNLYYGVFPISY